MKNQIRGNFHPAYHEDLWLSLCSVAIHGGSQTRVSVSEAVQTYLCKAKTICGEVTGFDAPILHHRAKKAITPCS